MMTFGLSDPAFLAAAGGAFNPLSIPGCVLWLKADGDVYNTGTTQATDGQAVETWVDASGNSNSFTQTVNSSYRPTFRSSGPYLEFDGSNDWMKKASFSPNLSSGSTLFVVLRKTSSAAEDATVYRPFFRLANNANALQCEAGTDGASPLKTEGFVVGTATIYRATPSAQFDTTAAHVLAVRVSTSQIEIYKDGLTWGGPTSVSGTISGSSTTAKLGSAEATDVPGQCGKFYAYECLLYDSNLSTGNREYVENGLGAKYGITITH